MCCLVNKVRLKEEREREERKQPQLNSDCDRFTRRLVQHNSFHFEATVVSCSCRGVKEADTLDQVAVFFQFFHSDRPFGVDLTMLRHTER